MNKVSWFRITPDVQKQIQHYLAVSDDTFEAILKEQLDRVYPIPTGKTTELDLMIYQAWIDYVWEPYIGKQPLDVSLPYIEHMERRHQVFMLMQFNFFMKLPRFWKLVRTFTCETPTQFAAKLLHHYYEERTLGTSPYRLSAEVLVSMITRIIRHELKCPPPSEFS